MKYPVRLVLNGEEHSREVDARMLLADFLRDDFDLPTPRPGCEASTCGRCEVLLDGKPVRSCNLLAVQADGRSVETVRAAQGPSPGGSVPPSNASARAVAPSSSDPSVTTDSRPPAREGAPRGEDAAHGG